MSPNTKIDLNHRKIAHLEGLDELAEILFLGNRNHKRIFLTIFIELKWADNQFLPTLEPIADQYDLSRRVLETVRAKMRRLGIIDHISRFNQKHGYKEGWTFSNRFSHSLNRLAEISTGFKERKDARQQQKDKDTIKYL